MALSVLVAILLARTDAIVRILTATEELEAIGSFIAGMFFTSVFTTAPAIATLGEIAQSYSVYATAALGAAGAVVGDLIIFRFIKDRLAEDVLELVKHQSYPKRFKALLKLRFFRYFTFLLGGIVIASPLPDEIGISLLGFSKMDSRAFIVLSYIFNFVGIVFIGFAARALA